MRLFPRFRKLFRLVEKSRPTNLDAAMIQVSNAVKPCDAFCIKETNWQHVELPTAKQFTVTIFCGPELKTQITDEQLNVAVDRALAEYRA